MRRLLLILPLGLFVVLTIAFGAQLIRGRDPAKRPSALIDRPAPQFALPALSQAKPGFSTADLRGQAIDLLGRLGLSDRVDHWPAQLSGGQKQRVAIARAIAGAPEVILADEPTAALDGRTGVGVAAALRDLARERGCAVVVVSHDPRMLPYADRVLTLEDGTITDDRPDGAGAN